MCPSSILFFFQHGRDVLRAQFPPLASRRKCSSLFFLPPNDDDDDHSPRFVRVLTMKDPSCARHQCSQLLTWKGCTAQLDSHWFTERLSALQLTD